MLKQYTTSRNGREIIFLPDIHRMIFFRMVGKRELNHGFRFVWHNVPHISSAIHPPGRQAQVKTGSTTKYFNNLKFNKYYNHNQLGDGNRYGTYTLGRLYFFFFLGGSFSREELPVFVLWETWKPRWNQVQREKKTILNVNNFYRVNKLAARIDIDLGRWIRFPPPPRALSY